MVKAGSDGAWTKIWVVEKWRGVRLWGEMCVCVWVGVFPLSLFLSFTTFIFFKKPGYFFCRVSLSFLKIR